MLKACDGDYTRSKLSDMVFKATQMVNDAGTDDSYWDVLDAGAVAAQSFPGTDCAEVLATLVAAVEQQ